MKTELNRIAAKAQKDPKFNFTALAHHLTPELLWSCLKVIPRNSAPGIDGETVELAISSFKEWSQDVLRQVHEKGYRPAAVKRVYIPKPGKSEKRPIGIPTIRDRVLQRAVTKVLEQIYEQDFCDHSFGGRPKVGAHNAVSTVKYTIAFKKVSWVYEADLKQFFCSLDHGWMLRFLEHRVGDDRIICLIRRWLKAGTIDDGEYHKSEKGTPQGGSISVLLSNVYMHYVLDLWFEKKIKPTLKGEAYLTRYIDDFVVCFQLQQDAVQFSSLLKDRLEQFRLETEPSKTKLMKFGRFASRDAKRAKTKPATFDFLGFTFHGVHFPQGNYAVGLKITKSKLRQCIAKLKGEMLRLRHRPLKAQSVRINAFLRGFYQYFGVPFNGKVLPRMLRYATKQWRKVLSSRSQSGRKNWDKFNAILKAYPLVEGKLKYSHLTFQAVNQELNSLVRENRTLGCVGAGSGDWPGDPIKPIRKPLIIIQAT